MDLFLIHTVSQYTYWCLLSLQIVFDFLHVFFLTFSMPWHFFLLIPGYYALGKRNGCKHDFRNSVVKCAAWEAFCKLTIRTQSLVCSVSLDSEIYNAFWAPSTILSRTGWKECTKFKYVFPLRWARWTRVEFYPYWRMIGSLEIPDNWAHVGWVLQSQGLVTAQLPSVFQPSHSSSLSEEQSNSFHYSLWLLGKLQNKTQKCVGASMFGFLWNI